MMENVVQKLRGKDEINVLFLCSGNIVRSPAAEMLFEHELEERFGETRIKSVSGATTFFNQQIMDLTKDFLLKEGILPERILKFFPRNVKQYPELLEEADLIIGMTSSHIRLIPKQFRAKAYTLSELATGEKYNIPDPWGDALSAYQEIYAIIKDYIKKLVDQFETWQLVP